jgi:hypothetical protein
MSTQIILKILWLRHQPHQRDRWTHQKLGEHQRLALLREHTYIRLLRR